MSGTHPNSLDQAKTTLAAMIASAQENIQATQEIQVPAPDAEVELHPSTPLSGPEKRVADAQDAQRRMSKAGTALDAKLARADETLSLLEKMADRFARMSEPQPAAVDQESLAKAIQELMQLDGGAVFGPVFSAFTQNVQELASGLEALRQTVSGLIEAQRQTLPQAVPNVDFMMATYPKDMLDALAPGGAFDDYLAEQSGAYRSTLEAMFSQVNTQERADLVLEMNKFVDWMGKRTPVKHVAAATATVPPVASAPVLTPGEPDRIPAAVQIGAGSGVAPSGAGNLKTLSQAEFDNYALLRSRMRTEAEKKNFDDRYAATVKAMLA